MAFVNATTAPPPLETTISRRNANYHPNLWNDSFIQSLSSPYSACSYRERRDTLRKEIKDILTELGKAEHNTTANNLLERFWTVDNVQRLGMGPYFDTEIKLALDYSFKYWNQDGITLDLNATALGFLTLRINGYHVSSDVFNMYKDNDGQFLCPVANREAHCHQLRSMLSLHRASELVFPGETILKEVNIVTTKYLEHALKEWKESKLDKNQLIMEVEYALRYPWRCNAPRWEARNYIEIFKQDNTFNTKNNVGFNQKLLELAILDFNILQCQHQSELKQFSRWCKNSTITHMDFYRHRPVELYFWCTLGLFAEEFGTYRIGVSKLTTMCTLLDDIYDIYGTLDELKPFATALLSGDILGVDSLPDYMKVSLKWILETWEEIEKEVEKKQGHNLNVKKYAQDIWKSYVLSYLKEAEWNASNYIPTLDEYFENGYYSSGMPIILIYSVLLMEIILSDTIFKELDFPSSKLHTLPPMVVRLIDDSKDFQEEEDRGEVVSSIMSFKRDNPGSTNKDALNYINNRLECCIEDLNKEYLESSNFMACYKNLYFNVATRGVLFKFHDGDGFATTNNQMQNAINKILMEPIEM